MAFNVLKRGYKRAVVATQIGQQLRQTNFFLKYRPMPASFCFGIFSTMTNIVQYLNI